MKETSFELLQFDLCLPIRSGWCASMANGRMSFDISSLWISSSLLLLRINDYVQGICVIFCSLVLIALKSSRMNTSTHISCDTIMSQQDSISKLQSASIENVIIFTSKNLSQLILSCELKLEWFCRIFLPQLTNSSIRNLVRHWESCPSYINSINNFTFNFWAMEKSLYFQEKKIKCQEFLPKYMISKWDLIFSARNIFQQFNHLTKTVQSSLFQVFMCKLNSLFSIFFINKSLYHFIVKWILLKMIAFASFTCDTFKHSGSWFEHRV